MNIYVDNLLSSDWLKSAECDFISEHFVLAEVNVINISGTLNFRRKIFLLQFLSSYEDFTTKFLVEIKSV